MEIETVENGIIINNGKVTLFIEESSDGIFVINQSKNTATYKKRRSRNNFLFTNAESIDVRLYKEYEFIHV